MVPAVVGRDRSGEWAGVAAVLASRLRLTALSPIFITESADVLLS